MFWRHHSYLLLYRRGTRGIRTGYEIPNFDGPRRFGLRI